MKFKEVLISIFLLGMLTGIIPALLVAFMEKHIWFAVLIGIFDVVWIIAELYAGMINE